MNLISFTLGPPAASLKRLPEATLSLASVRDNGSENWMGCGVQGGFKDREAMCRDMAVLRGEQQKGSSRELKPCYGSRALARCLPTVLILPVSLSLPSTVLRPGVIPPTELRARDLEVSCVQVSCSHLASSWGTKPLCLPSRPDGPLQRPGSWVALLQHLDPQWQGSGDGWAVPCLQEQRPSLFFFSSKTALLEGLEVDQYMWGILNAIQQ